MKNALKRLTYQRRLVPSIQSLTKDSQLRLLTNPARTRSFIQTMNSLIILLMVSIAITCGHTLSMPSFYLIEDVHSSYAYDALGISLLYCTWEGMYRAKLTDCPNNDVGWGGVANFDVNNTGVNPDNDNELRIPFKTKYISTPPICSFSFEGEEFAFDTYMTRIATQSDRVSVYLFNSYGDKHSWRHVKTKISVICYGPTDSSTLQGRKAILKQLLLRRNKEKRPLRAV